MAIPEPDVRFLHNSLRDSRSEGWTLLDSAPATRRYRYVSVASILMKSLSTLEVGPGKARRGCAGDPRA